MSSQRIKHDHSNRTQVQRNGLSALIPIFVFVIMLPSLACGITWTAKWIWQASDGPQNSWVCFRKTVNLSTVPASVTANIGVDTKYWLWINGQLAVFEGGVKRGPRPGDTYYDEIEIGKYLKPGSNTIAVLATYFGRTSFSHINSGKAGLVFQADVGGTAISSDASWKVKLHPAYAPTVDVGPGGDDYGDAFPVDFDASKSLGDWTSTGWTSEGYSDASWSAATEKGTPPAAPWNKLEKNPLPPWTNHGYLYYVNYPASKFPIMTTAQTTIKCRLPHNLQLTPWLEITADAGKVITMSTDDPDNAIDARYITKSGVQSFEGLAWMNGHEVHYSIPAGVTVTALKYHWTGAGNIVGDFACNDSFYTKLWWKARNTLYVNMRDNFMDCPDRERAQWIGDIANSSTEVYYTIDNFSHKLVEKAIRQICEFRNGAILHAPVPGGYNQELAYQSLYFAGSTVWWYYINTGDLATTTFAYPFVRDYLKLWTMNANGLINLRDGDWGWIDGTATGYEPNPNEDKSVIQNGFYYTALLSGKKMAIVTGNTADTAWFNGRISSIKNAYNTLYWNGKFYTSGGTKDDRANGIAITSGLADSSRYATIISDVLTSVMYASPYMEHQVSSALCLARRGDLALTRMRTRYASLVNDAFLTTLPEYFPPVGQVYNADRDGSYNHEWNTPNTILSRYIAGIEPETAGWATYHVFPQMGTLTSISQVVPSVKGNINLILKKSSSSFQVGLTSPVGTSAIVGIPKSNAFTLKGVYVNGTSVWSNGAFVGGVTGITWNGEDATYLKFNVAPGTWNFVSSDGSVTSAQIDKSVPAHRRVNNVHIDATGLLHLVGPCRVDVNTVAGRHIATLFVGQNQSSIRLPSIARGSVCLIRVTSEHDNIRSKSIYRLIAQ